MMYISIEDYYVIRFNRASGMYILGTVFGTIVPKARYTTFKGACEAKRTLIKERKWYV